MLKQKFKHGNLVHIIEGSCQPHFKQGLDAVILGSYDDFYGTGDIFQYQVIFEDGNKCAWYEGNQLMLIDEGGEHLITQIKENQIRSEAEDILKRRDLNHLKESDIVVLLRFIGFDYSMSNNYFGIWEKVLPLFDEIINSESTYTLKEKYPEYDIEGVWNIFHLKGDKR